MDKPDVFRAFQPRTPALILLSGAHGTFSRTDHMLRHNGSLHKFKKIEITPRMSFPKAHVLKLEINCKGKKQLKPWICGN